MLFTKKQIQCLINHGKNLKFFEEYMGFENIGQGYGYKSVEAWNSEKSDVIVYIPEYCFDTSFFFILGDIFDENIGGIISFTPCKSIYV